MSNLHLSAGKDIRSSSDMLSKVTVGYIYDAIKNPRPEIMSKIRQLRIVRELNKARYDSLKKELPYFVCGIFTPSFRKTVNFAYTSYFILDIDHVQGKGLNVGAIKAKFKSDTRVLLCFVSPGGDGLKVMFRLKERCYDVEQYKTFYKIFLKKFSERHNLEQVIDNQTCDVCRACFISSDPDIYMNQNAEPIDMKEYVNPEEDIFEALGAKRAIEKETIVVKGTAYPEPDDDALAKIRQTLNPQAAKKEKEKNVYVPPQLDQIMGPLKDYVEQRGIVLERVGDINYGKKIEFRLGLKKAEINLFFGKRGFTVVMSPKSGTDAQLNELMCEVVKSFLIDLRSHA